MVTKYSVTVSMSNSMIKFHETYPCLNFTSVLHATLLIETVSKKSEYSVTNTRANGTKRMAHILWTEVDFE